jgi:hypothetical protein
VPVGLPRYDLDIRLDTAGRLVTFRETITWTNPAAKPAESLVLNFYPLYRVPNGDTLLLAKTLELLRLDPSAGIDPKGQHGSIRSVTLKPADGPARPLVFSPSGTNPTAVVVPLPTPVGPGETVTVELAGQIRVPPKQGRWGQWDGVTFLTNALPVVAFYDDRGWHDVPFVPWHQPFWNEAGVYTATITLPADEKLACSAAVKDESPAEGGMRRVTMQPFVGRDFAVVCSPKFQEFTGAANLPDGRTVALRCLAQPQHRHYAREMLRVAAEAIAVYSAWLGPYPSDQFTLVESFFGWNGNESAGLVMIDERVFDMPKLGRGYIEYLVSHELCHQWWYNLVGTNGYSETFLDEGAATYFTHRLMDQKYGKNNDLLAWPKEVAWLPNIKRENYRFASLVGAIRRGDEQPAVADLPKFGHLVGLFSGAYDRGSKVFGMIEQRLGPEFLPFSRMLVAKYSWKVLSVAQLKAELVGFTGEATAAQWDQLFDRWVYDKGLTDWRVDEVQTKALGPRDPAAGVPVEVVVSQHREFDEPTVVGFQLADGDGFPIRVPVGGGVARSENGTSVEPLGGGKYRVRVTLPSEPTQVTVDPDRVLLDANLGDNSWKPPMNARLVPLYTLLNETDLTNDYDRWNLAAGPWVWGPSYPDPWYTRSTMAGVRAGAFRTQVFSGGVYAAARYDYRDLVVGADGLLDHWPGTHTQVGFNVEQRVAGPWFDDSGSRTAFRGVLYGRYVIQYGSSLYLPPISYVDLYTGYQDNFLPVARESPPGAVRPAWTQLTGLHFRLNLYTPYWNPERGVWVDLVAAGGAAGLDRTVGTAQLKGELAAARRLPDDWGPYLSRLTLAGRVAAQGAWPGRGEFFTLGGGTLFRGFDLKERQGSFLWAANAEVRVPVFREVRWNTLDNVFGVRGVSLAGFYDAGEVYAAGRSVGGSAHALGTGLRVDLAVFSFMERATVRLDVAKTINAATPFQVWFGVQHPF